MAPKLSKAIKKDTAMLQPKVLNDSLVMPLSDISTAADSGWRELDTKRVYELKEKFLRGEFGQNLLKKPAVLSEDGTGTKLKKATTDGNTLLVDGKHCIQALKEIKKLLDAHAGDGDAHAGDGDAHDGETDELVLSPTLAKVFEEGVTVTVLAFPDSNDDDAILAWVVAIHDVEVNTFKPCSMADLVDVAERLRVKQPGGKWKDAQSALEKVYGHGRRMFVYRMVSCAQSLDKAVLEALSKAAIPNSWIFENKYFLGHGADASMRMSKSTQICVIGIGQEDLESGTACSWKTFRDETCMAYRHAELWLASKRKVSGVSFAIREKCYLFLA